MDKEVDDDFEEFVQKFYADLLSKQQRLTTEMEQIIQDNLWDLYIRE